MDRPDRGLDFEDDADESGLGDEPETDAVVAGGP